MNCANHADASAVAYCRTCGKGLCANCTRPVKGVIYCEDCLGAKMQGTVPPGTPAVPGAPLPATGYVAPPPPPSSGPNPALAGILAGFFPFGVGAVYTGQYAKGLAHLIVMALLFAIATANGNSDGVIAISVFAIMFFYVYQIVDSVRSARALQMGQAPPDPFNLTQTFTGGGRIDTSRIPAGSMILIAVGVLFLLHTLGIWEYGVGRFWPIILIALGGWMFLRNFGILSDGSTSSRRLMGPALMTTIGILFLLQELHVAHFGRTWPIILLVLGAAKLVQGSAINLSPAQAPAQSPTSTGGPSVPPPPSEVTHG